MTQGGKELQTPLNLLHNRNQCRQAVAPTYLHISYHFSQILSAGAREQVRLP
jgi:hypothetical protein